MIKIPDPTAIIEPVFTPAVLPVRPTMPAIIKPITKPVRPTTVKPVPLRPIPIMDDLEEPETTTWSTTPGTTTEMTSSTETSTMSTSTQFWLMSTIPPSFDTVDTSFVGVGGILPISSGSSSGSENLSQGSTETFEPQVLQSGPHFGLDPVQQDQDRISYKSCLHDQSLPVTSTNLAVLTAVKSFCQY